jgi:hypothetical protein
VTDQTQTPPAQTLAPQLPAAAVPVVDRMAHLAAGAAAVYLANHHLISAGAQTQDANLGAAALVMLAGIAFSWLRGRLEHTRLAAALEAKS